MELDNKFHISEVVSSQYVSGIYGMPMIGSLNIDKSFDLKCVSCDSLNVVLAKLNINGLNIRMEFYCKSCGRNYFKNHKLLDEFERRKLKKRLMADKRT